MAGVRIMWGVVGAVSAEIFLHAIEYSYADHPRWHFLTSFAALLFAVWVALKQERRLVA